MPSYSLQFGPPVILAHSLRFANLDPHRSASFKSTDRYKTHRPTADGERSSASSRAASTCASAVRYGGKHGSPADRREGGTEDVELFQTQAVRLRGGHRYGPRWPARTACQTVEADRKSTR